MARHRPVIAVTTSRHRSKPLWWFNVLSVWLGGGRAYRLVPEAGVPDLGAVDGLIVGGGDDIGAELYGGRILPDVRVDPARDRLELTALEQALERRLPVLGICRGAQMLNVFHGGSLHVEVHEVYEHAPRLRTVLPRKMINLDAGSRLHGYVRQTGFRVNALHHQSIDRLGRGLTVVGQDQYGIVQAVENPELPFLIGVQWHPELLPYRTPHRRLFRGFLDRAHERARGRA